MTALHTLSVVIGATLQGGFGATITSSKNQLMQLGQAIKQLEGSSKSISTFQTLQRDTLLAKKGWVDAEAQVKSLAQQMAQAAIPSKELQRSFEQSQNAALKAKNAYQQKRDALHQLGTQLRQSGQDMGNLVQEQTKLGSSLERLKYHYTTLDNLMQRRQGVLARRAQLRGELMDAVALGAALVAPIKAAMDFEKAMAGVRKSVQLNPVQFQQLGETFKVMSRTIPVSAEGLAQIAASGGKLKLSAQDLISFTKSVATMSTLFDVPADQIGQDMAKLANLWHLSTQEITLMGDAWVHLGRKMVIKPEQLIQALSTIGSTVRQCGLSIQQASAMAGALMSVTKTPEAAGKDIQTLLLRLSSAAQQGKKFQQALQRIGWSATKLAKGLKNDAQGTLLSFLGTLAKLDNQTRSGILKDLVGNKAQANIALMVNNLPQIAEGLEMVAQKSQYADKAQEAMVRRSQTAAGSFALFKNALTEVGIGLGTVLLPPLTLILKSLNWLLSTLSDLMSHWPRLTAVITYATAALIGGKVALTAYAYAQTFVQEAILKSQLLWHGLCATLALVKTGFIGVKVSALLARASMAFSGVIHALGAAFTGLAGRVFPAVIAGWHMLTAAFAAHPIGVAVTALAIVATLVIANWSKVQAFFKTIWEPIKPIWEAFKQWVGSFWASISAPFKAIGGLWGKFWGSNKPSTQANAAKLQPIKDALKQPLAVGSSKGTTNNTHNNQNITINVQASPHHDTKRIADEVMQRFKAHNRGALFDPLGGVA